MTNRVLLISSIAAVMASACVNDSPLYVTGFFSLDPSHTGACALTAGTVSQFAGSLDLSGSPKYEILVGLKSELDSSLDTKGEGVTLVTGKQRNTVIIDTIAFSYTSSPTATIPSITYEVETLPVTIVIEPGGTQAVKMPLLGPKALEALNKAVVNPNETSNVRVKFEFQGAINSGGRIKSTPITFPITVTRSGATCAAGFCPTGACGEIGGQDGAKLVCPTVTPSTDGGTATRVCPAPGATGPTP